MVERRKDTEEEFDISDHSSDEENKKDEDDFEINLDGAKQVVKRNKSCDKSE